MRVSSSTEARSQKSARIGADAIGHVGTAVGAPTEGDVDGWSSWQAAGMPNMLQAPATPRMGSCGTFRWSEAAALPCTAELREQSAAALGEARLYAHAPTAAAMRASDSASAPSAASMCGQ